MEGEMTFFVIDCEGQLTWHKCRVALNYRCGLIREIRVNQTKHTSWRLDSYLDDVSYVTISGLLALLLMHMAAGTPLKLGIDR
jgi:hypothetical protein